MKTKRENMKKKAEGVKKRITIQTQNITELATNRGFLMDDQIDITFIQECKVNEEEQGKIQKMFNDEDYDIIVGPCCKHIKKPSAGVGCASNKKKG